MEKIKQTRKALGVTQADLASLLGLNQSTVSRLESGALELDARTELALEALLSRGRAEPAAQAATVS